MYTFLPRILSRPYLRLMLIISDIYISKSKPLTIFFAKNFAKLVKGLWMDPKGPPDGAEGFSPPQELEKATFLVLY